MTGSYVEPELNNFVNYNNLETHVRSLENLLQICPLRMFILFIKVLELRMKHLRSEPICF